MARLFKNQVRLLTGWDERYLRQVLASGKVRQDDRGLFYAADVFRESPMAREALEQLRYFARHGEVWWTYAPSRWVWLEVAGLVKVQKADREEWTVRLTELGREVARELLEGM